MKNKGLKKKILAGGLAVLTVAAVVADTLVFHVYAEQLDKAFPGKSNNESEIEEVSANALEVAEEVEEEGAVLLENNGALPMSTTKINLLGYAAYNPVYGGTGSGGSSYLENRTDFVKAFTDAGIEVNPAIEEVYKSDANEDANTFEVDFSIKEVAATEALATEMGQEFKYTGDASFELMKEYSDTAVIVISRKGGEGNDLPKDMSEYGVTENDKKKHYLELSDAEESLIQQAKATFNDVIVLINTGNAMELGFLENEVQAGPDATGDIDAALWIGDPGDVGTKAVVSILKGEVNPSGRLVDIYPYAVETTPSFYNFDTYEYTNSSECFENFDSHPAYLLEYQEGIYVGYRYYETRENYDYVTLEGEEKTGLTYEDVVQYPFGYGLSYTTFDWSIADATAEGDINGDSTVSVTVNVTNTGDVAGKDVVELYYTAPYDAEGSHIQKAGAVLGGFAKTETIEPGETASVTITLDAVNMASYDDQRYYSTTGSYVLEKGDYVISLRKDSHHVVNDMQYTYHVSDSIVYAEQENATGVEENANYVGVRPGDENVAVNQFDDVAGDVTYLTRDDWNIVEGSNREATAEQLEIFKTALDLGEDYISESDEAPTMGAQNGVELSDLTGKAYDDADWDLLLDELTVDDLNIILATNGWGSSELKSIGKTQTYDMDGPAALSYVFDAFMGTCTYKTISYPCEVVLAATWNLDLAEKFGDAISKEGKAWQISGWYAPGANIHRSPFAGRNFEYYSEDPLISGTMAATVVAKAEENGMYCYMKHFVMNERETWRHYGLCTWANEQSMREIYLAPFEKAVKEGKATALMSSYNNIGTTWAGASKALLTNVLRNEWGFIGTVLTDNLEQHGFMSTEKAILAGGTSTLCNGMFSSDNINTLAETASGQLALREAAHQYLYTIANSYAVDFTTPMALWRVPAIIGSVVVYLLIAVVFVLIFRKKKETV